MGTIITSAVILIALCAIIYFEDEKKALVATSFAAGIIFVSIIILLVFGFYKTESVSLDEYYAPQLRVEQKVVNGEIISSDTTYIFVKKPKK